MTVVYNNRSPRTALLITLVVCMTALDYTPNPRVPRGISGAVADPAFGDAVLPRASEAGPLGQDAEALHNVDDFLIKVCTAIEDQL
jgi:hypothetical protein